MNPDYQLTSAEVAGWERRTDPEREEGGLADPVWRLANLYTCLDPNGKTVHFVPTPEQRLVIVCIFIRGWRRIVIPKARQLGMSLLLCLILLDGLIFREGFNGALIDKTAPDAEKKMREKIKFAWERVPGKVRETLLVKQSSNDKLVLCEPGAPESADSTLTVGINFRGGTVEMLVISEWGAIQNTDRMRSREIAAGALPSVERAEDGLCVVETTWKGGLDGEVGPLVIEALDTPEEQKGPRSWRILFFGWQTEAAYRQSHGYVDAISEKYFAELEAAGVMLTPEQKLWYAEKRRTATSDRTMKEEYPSLVHECWENIPQGSIFGPGIELARATGRVRDFETDRWPVHTFWDLGLPINTVAWYAQIRPEAILLVDVDMELDIEMTERAARMRAKGWNYGYHFLPWEAGQKSSLGFAPVVEYAKILGNNVRVVPRVGLVTDGNQMLQAIFSRLVFHKTRCKQGLEFLARYRAERESSTGIAKDVPVHNIYSHVADSLRQMAQAISAGMIAGANTVGAPVAERPSVPRAIMGMRM